jgi:hypothetical protein
VKSVTTVSSISRVLFSTPMGGTSLWELIHPSQKMSFFVRDTAKKVSEASHTNKVVS